MQHQASAERKGLKGQQMCLWGIARMSKAELSDTGSKVLFGFTGGKCLTCNKVVSLFGAIPLAINSNTRPICAEQPKESAELIAFL